MVSWIRGIKMRYFVVVVVHYEWRLKYSDELVGSKAVDLGDKFGIRKNGDTPLKVHR